MLKGEFTKRVKEALGLSSVKAADETVDKLFELIAEIVKTGEEVPIGCMGKFVVVEQAARKCRNLQTGETIDVPAKKKVKFKPSAAAKKLMIE